MSIRMKIVAAAVMAAVSSAAEPSTNAVEAASATNSVFSVKPEFLLAIRFVESTDGRYLGNQDGGTVYGPFQISYEYLKDANDFANTSYTLRDVSENENIAITVMCAYWNRYLPKDREVTYELLARIHNGGPRGYEKDSTIEYWRKVKAKMEEIENEKARTEEN